MDWVSEKPLYGGHRGLQLVSQVQCASLGTPPADLPLHPSVLLPPLHSPPLQLDWSVRTQASLTFILFHLPRLFSFLLPHLHLSILQGPAEFPQLRHAPVHSRDHWFCPLLNAENCSFLELNSHRD